MTSRPFRFGVVTPVLSDVASWRDQVRRIADQGYSTVLMPDVPNWQPAPGPTLALAAATADIRVGTWVYASPVRPAGITAWEAHTLSVLTEGRFEMGIGTGRPGIEDDVSALGMPVVAPSERLVQVRKIVRALREHDGEDLHTPVAMAVRGPTAQALAVEIADTVTFAVTADVARSDLIALANGLPDGRDLELALHVPAVGEYVELYMTGPDTDPAALRAMDSMLILPDDRSAAIEEILKRREEAGFTYVVIPAGGADALAPVVAELAGT